MAAISRSVNFGCSIFRKIVPTVKPLPALACRTDNSDVLPCQPSGSHIIVGQPVRHRYTNWQMVRDVKRRQLTEKHAVERLRVNSVRKNNVLPKELKEIADQDYAVFPRDANKARIVNRCVLTSRPRGVLERWRLSRLVWRHLADYNKLSGVTRATW